MKLTNTKHRSQRWYPNTWAEFTFQRSSDIALAGADLSTTSHATDIGDSHTEHQCRDPLDYPTTACFLSWSKGHRSKPPETEAAISWLLGIWTQVSDPAQELFTHWATISSALFLLVLITFQFMLGSKRRGCETQPQGTYRICFQLFKFPGWTWLPEKGLSNTQDKECLRRQQLQREDVLHYGYLHPLYLRLFVLGSIPSGWGHLHY